MATQNQGYLSQMKPGMLQKGPIKKRRSSFTTHRILTGPVQRVKEWMTKLSSGVTYVVYGRLLNAVRVVPRALPSSAIKVTFILEDLQSSSRIRCAFYEVEKPMIQCAPGTYLRVVGVPLPDGSIVAVDVRHEDPSICVHVSGVAQQSERGLFLATAADQFSDVSKGPSQNVPHINLPSRNGCYLK